MKTTKIKIKNLFGIAEQELDGRSVEVTGTNGTGKTSIIDAIRYALTNDSARDLIIKDGENEGEIIIETDTGLHIDRKKRTQQADYKSVKENGRDISSPESFLKSLFSPLQLDPVAFTQLPKKEQNRVILDLIDFDWDLYWIKDKFGEIPKNINYDQNILQVLHDIQAENGDYFQSRQNINRDIRNKIAFVEDIAKNIPPKYDVEYWDSYDLGAKYAELDRIKQDNGKIERAKLFLDGQSGKTRGIEFEYQSKLTAAKSEMHDRNEMLSAEIEKLKAALTAAEKEKAGLTEKYFDKEKLAKAEYDAEIAKLGKDMDIAREYAAKTITDTLELTAEIDNAEKMKAHINEYRRMQGMRNDIETLTEQAEELTEKIELARSLPGKILETATIPIDGFTVVDGIPLINGLPISNLSEGEQLSLCVDVALSKPSGLQIILIDGAEKLSDENRNKLYTKCKEKGLQFIATRTNNSSELEVTYL